MTLLNNIFWIADPFYLVAEGLSLLLLITAVLHFVQQLLFRLMPKTLGKKSIAVSAVIGAPVHELSHAFFCLLFGHKIKKIVFFAHDGFTTLGYVTHSYNNRNPWQVIGNFVIAIAPVLGGIFTIYLLTVLLLPSGKQLFLLFSDNSQKHITEFSLPGVLSICKGVWLLIQQDYLASPFKLFFWCYLCGSICLHLCPSREDLKGSGAGFSFVLLLLLIMSALFNYFGLTFLTQIFHWVSPIVMLYGLSVFIVLLLVLLVVASAGLKLILGYRS